MKMRTLWDLEVYEKAFGAAMRVFECSSGNPFQQSLCFFVPLGGHYKALVEGVHAINDRVYRGWGDGQGREKFDTDKSRYKTAPTFFLNPYQQSLCFFVPLGGHYKALVEGVHAINDRV